MSKVSQIITETVLKRMEEAEKNGEVFYWVKPFSEGSPNKPYSYDTGIPYRGINRILLDNDEFLTFAKVQEMNKKKDAVQYHIRKGAKANIVCYYNTIPVIDEETGVPQIDERTGEQITKGFWKYYRVFSRSDVVRADNGENLPSKFEFKHYSHEDATEQMTKALDRFNRLYEYFCEKYGITLQVIKDGTQAYFSPSDMVIKVPRAENFRSLSEYCKTYLHELSHATGAKSILGRFKDMPDADAMIAMQSYSREELVAELSASMLAAELEIPDDSEHSDNSVAYIHSWASYLKDRPNEILAASAKAEASCQLIMDTLQEMEHEQEITKERGEEYDR